jgi:sugar-specific transcriptional regulator TrmB
MGLTPLEAKIYLLLNGLGKRKAMEISKMANADRANTYQALERLHRSGLVEKILGRPTLYSALPLQLGINELLKHKKEEYRKIQIDAGILLQQVTTSETCLEATDIGVSRKKKEGHLEEIARVCASARESIDLILNEKTFLGGVIDFHEPHIEAIKRGVKYRLITEKTDHEPIMKGLKALMDEPNFRIKYRDFTPKAEMCIADKSSVAVSLIPNTGVGKQTVLHTKNTGIVEILQGHFDREWDQAYEFTLNPRKRAHQKSKRTNILPPV